MKAFRTLLSVLGCVFLTASAAPAFSQMVQRGPVRMMGGANKLTGFYLLNRKEVQKELKMSPSQIAQIPKPSAARPTDIASARKLTEENESKAVQILTPAQRVRYQQLALQAKGMGALVFPDIAKKVGLSTAQVSQIQQIEGEVQQGVFQKKMQANKPDGGITQIRMTAEDTKAMRSQIDAQVSKLLTPAQKAQWKKLLGKPFNL
jgi:hypothetical protein